MITYKCVILEPRLSIRGPSHKTVPTFNSYPIQKGVPNTAKYISTAPIVNLDLETSTQYNFPHFEPTTSQAYKNNQCTTEDGTTQEEGVVRETPIE